ncbi:hypothetical protein [Thiothrix subterranea]|nr:hypothetical protein [Thiothrix subterranea]
MTGLADVDIELGPVLSFGVTVVTALALLIPLRKAIKTVNRS